MGEIWVVGVKSFSFVKIATKKKEIILRQEFPIFCKGNTIFRSLA